MVIIGSHNTMSYLPVARWWMRPVAWAARCQNRTIDEQYGAGVRLFDIRVAYDHRGRVHFRHGAVRYSGNVESVLSRLNKLGESVTVRIVLERVADAEDVSDFTTAVSAWKSVFANIRFVCGVRKDTWSELCGLEQIEGKMLQWCGSMRGDFLGSVWPWMWARCHKADAETLVAGTQYEYVLMDFVAN